MTTFKHDTVVFDLDGTLSCGKHRLHLAPADEDKNRSEAWADFNMACNGDSPISDNIELFNSLYTKYRMVILTGRSEIAREKTTQWLKQNGVEMAGVLLCMRPRDDNRKDVEFKEEVLRELSDRGFRVLCCFDDLEHVVKHIRAMGITCHQVTHYDNPTLAEKDHRK